MDFHTSYDTIKLSKPKQTFALLKRKFHTTRNKVVELEKRIAWYTLRDRSSKLSSYEERALARLEYQYLCKTAELSAIESMIAQFTNLERSDKYSHDSQLENRIRGEHEGLR